MTLAVTCNCHRHVRISFFLMLWLVSYIQMIDQLRLDLAALRCNKKIAHNTYDTINHQQQLKMIANEKAYKLINPFLQTSGKI